MLSTSLRTTFIAIAAAGLAALPAAAEPPVGKPAPEFTARDSNGRDVTLSSLKGKTIVLEWTNDGCPYVAKHYGTGNMQSLQKDATGKGVVWLTVVSSAPGTQGHVNDLEANKWVDTRKANSSAVLLDPKGTLGRLYDAKTTPHMYVIDPAGTLVYRGAIDDKPTANHADVKTARNYVREALDAVAAGKAPQVTATRAYGCSVKYGASS